MRCGIVLAVLLSILTGCRSAPDYDIVVYGGSSAGVIAAIAASQCTKMAPIDDDRYLHPRRLSVALIEPSQHIGGMTTGGLGATDIGNKAAIGGMAREFYRRVGAKYGKNEAWTFEPHVAEQVLEEWLQSTEVHRFRGERLERGTPPKCGNPLAFDRRSLVGEQISAPHRKLGIRLQNNRIVEIEMESGRRFSAHVFIDATYEGDLMAAARVRYAIGREGNATYGETLNGVQVANAVKHQFVKPVDPYIIPGDPSSGPLPGIEVEPSPPVDGTGDHRIQAYCFRMCTTDVPANRREWEKPADYDPLLYELLLRNFEAGDHRVPWHPVMMPNRKTDTNNNFAVSTDFIGMSYGYPLSYYPERERIVRAHESYQKGLMWTLANSPRVPDAVRKHFQTWGLAKDEFTDNDNWPRQLYIREARRMIGEYVMTQHDCQGRRTAADPIGLAAYTMDSHNVQRYVDTSGHVRNEGDVQVGGFPPYPVSYRAVLPKREECTNLLVPVCLSASHIAYGSIRMEPVFMVVAESATAAAALAIERGVDLQVVPYEELSERLHSRGQILRWPP
jgi:hypothetical protein